MPLMRRWLRRDVADLDARDAPDALDVALAECEQVLRRRLAARAPIADGVTLVAALRKIARGADAGYATAVGRVARTIARRERVIEVRTASGDGSSARGGDSRACW